MPTQSSTYFKEQVYGYYSLSVRNENVEANKYQKEATTAESPQMIYFHFWALCVTITLLECELCDFLANQILWILNVLTTSLVLGCHFSLNYFSRDVNALYRNQTVGVDFCRIRKDKSQGTRKLGEGIGDRYAHNQILSLAI